MGSTADVQKLVHGLGGTVGTDLPIIHGFTAAGHAVLVVKSGDEALAAVGHWWAAGP